jgi:cell division protein FtsZ
MLDAFKRADEVLLNAVQGISDLINNTGHINSDFADVRTIMQNKGLALMGIGYGDGEHRAVEAATNAISSPLLEDISINGATGIIINITGGSSLTIHEVNEATTLIMEAAHEDAEIIFGTVIDEALKEQVKVTVIATGLGPRDQLAQVNDTIVQQSVAPMVAHMDQQSLQAALAPAQPAGQVAQPWGGAPVAQAQQHVPPHPNSQMLAAAAAYVNGQAVMASHLDLPREVVPATQEPVEPMMAVSRASVQAAAQAHAPAATRPANEAHDLARAKTIAQQLGITNLADDEYDIPTYIRRQQEREL